MSFPMSERYIAVVREEGLSIGVVRWLFLVFKGYVGKALLYRVVLPRCTHVFVQSERMRDDVAAHGIQRERMTPVPMGVDLERSLPSRAEAHVTPALDGQQVIAYLGTFDRPRRLEFLLEVFQRLASRLPDVRLLMIGDGPLPEDRERLEVHAASLGIAERIVWTGWVSPEDAWRWLVRADVAVSLFPRGELLDSASPTKVVEYMALGIPVVANDQPDQAQVLRDSGAGLCAPMEHAEFAVALETILSNPELAHGMRVAGPPYVAAHRGYAHIADEVASVYRRYVGMKEYTCGSQVSQA
jgi:glycosyltransferase involved in cell wall biosynthesis